MHALFLSLAIAGAATAILSALASTHRRPLARLWWRAVRRAMLTLCVVAVAVGTFLDWAEGTRRQ